jgi:prepilin-type N-terminal cleavage/methylation domain-containing protein
MKKGGRLGSASGFTIVETLIVLAVSSVLFVVAGMMISGRQAKTEFQVGVRDVQTKVQQVVNEVKSGYYPSVPFSCSDGGVGDLTISPGAEAQGTHGSCIFVGKAIVVEPDAVRIFSLAGRRAMIDAITSSRRDVENPTEARVTAIAPTSSKPTIPDATETYKLPYGLTFTGKYAVGGASQSTFAFSIMSSFAQSSGSSIGSQTLGVYGFNNGFAGADSKRMAELINAEKTTSDAFGAGGATQARFCIQSGGTNQSAWIIIGNDTNAGTAVRSEIKGNTSCS